MLLYGNKTSSTKITLCDISKQKTEGKILLFDYRYVYDVTSFINEHPGGEYAIKKRCNNMTPIDNDLRFHSNRAINISKKLAVGEISKCTTYTCNICNHTR